MPRHLRDCHALASAIAGASSTDPEVALDGTPGRRLLESSAPGPRDPRERLSREYGRTGSPRRADPMGSRRRRRRGKRQDLVSIERSTSEYCGCSETNGDHPWRSWTASAQASSHPGKFDAPSARTLPACTRRSSASRVASIGTSGSGAWTWYRSMTSAPSRRRLASHASRIRWGRALRPLGRNRDPDLVATTTSSRWRASHGATYARTRRRRTCRPCRPGCRRRRRTGRASRAILAGRLGPISIVPRQRREP